MSKGEGGEGFPWPKQAGAPIYAQHPFGRQEFRDGSRCNVFDSGNSIASNLT